MTYITIDTDEHYQRNTMMLVCDIQEATDTMGRTMTAREPDFKQGGLWCPSCGRRVFNADVDAWCGHCGQRIKWED